MAAPRFVERGREDIINMMIDDLDSLRAYWLISRRSPSSVVDPYLNLD